MSDLNNTKKYPVSTSQVAQMLKFHSGVNDDSHSAAAGLPVAGLPVAAEMENSHDVARQSETQETAPASSDSNFSKIVGNLYIRQNSGQADNVPPAAGSHNSSAAPAKILTASPGPLKAFLKAAIPYVVVFSVAVFVYFFFFSKVDFSGAFKVQAKPAAPKESALQQLQSKSLAGYNTWIKQFYFEVSDSKLLDPDADNSGNGLTNFQKYLLNLNPKSYDSLGLGMADSEALAKGINPSSGDALTDEQKAILDKYFDMETITNRLTLAHLQSSRAGQVAGASSGILGNSAADPFASGGGQASVYGIRSGLPAASSQNGSASVSGVSSGVSGQSPLAESLDIDQSKPGRVQVPSLKIDVPLIWTQDTKNFDKDLQSGVVHYPGTAMPGQLGTAYISGHSSNYVWAKGSYNQIFSTLGNLADDASFSVTVTLKDGKTATLHYVVTSRQEFKATDQAQFRNFPKSVVALSTCWPVNTTQRRLVVFGELTQIEK